MEFCESYFGLCFLVRENEVNDEIENLIWEIEKVLNIKNMFG